MFPTHQYGYLLSPIEDNKGSIEVKENNNNLKYTNGNNSYYIGNKQ